MLRYAHYGDTDGLGTVMREFAHHVDPWIHPTFCRVIPDGQHHCIFLRTIFRALPSSSSWLLFLHVLYCIIFAALIWSTKVNLPSLNCRLSQLVNPITILG